MCDMPPDNHAMTVCLQVQPDMVNLIVHSSAGAVMARFNISKDLAYFPVGKRKGDKLGAVSRLHTIQASNMTTIPCGFPTRPEMFHRPLGLWNPLVSKKLHVKNQNKLQSGWLCVRSACLSCFVPYPDSLCAVVATMLNCTPCVVL